MFIVCNYLDVSRLDAVPDGFVVEECSKYSDDLDGYAIICREHRIENVMNWARTNMGAKFPMFEKQLSINKTKAMCFIKAKGKIKSFTEEFVLSCGSLEKFKETYGIGKEEETPSEPVQEDATQSDVVTETVEETTEDQTEKVAADTVTKESDDETDQSVPERILTEEEKRDLSTEPIQIQNVGSVVTPIVDTPVEPAPVLVPTETQVVEESASNAEEQIIEEINPNDASQLQYAAIRKSEEEAQSYSPVVQKCQQDCIYNSDGTFKGFTEGQVLKLLQHLKELDNRIALDDLDPEYVLTTEEVEKTATYLDSVAPSIFKAFFIREVSNVGSEADRIRISAILNHLAAFIASLNK